MRTLWQKRRTPLAVSTLLLLVAAACADPIAPPAPQSRAGALADIAPGQPGVGVWVCKVSTVAGIFTFNATASNTEGTLAPSPISVDVLTPGSDPAEYCSRVWTPGTNPAGPTTDVTVSENVPAGYQVDSILLVTTPPGGRTIYYNLTALTVTASFSQGYLVKFFNSQTICKDQNATNYGQPGACTYPPAGKGCTPGYWKVSQHWDAWPAGYSPSQSIATYFPAASGYTLNGSSMGSYTLVQGLAFQGGSDAAGGAQILLRAGIAGLLNSASSFGGSYPMTTSQLLSAVNSALASGDRATMVALAATIDGYNNAGCPLN